MNLAAHHHVLIIDDDALLRGMAARTLRHAGLIVSVAAGGDEGLAMTMAHSYDLILLDVVMSGLDGYEVCRRIRLLPERSATPILMLTGLSDTASIEFAFDQGATDFITKPINWTLLAHKVRYALRTSAVAEAMRRGRESLARAQRLACMGNWTLFPDGRLEASAEMTRIFGLPGAESPSLEHWLLQILPEDRETVRRARQMLLNEGEPYQLTFRIRCDDGVPRTLIEQAALREASSAGEDRIIEGITQDISDRVEAQERILELAHYDAVTALPNRDFFAELVSPALERASRRGTGCAMMHVDIDRFESVNDAFGRHRGDEVLKAVADRLRSWTRRGDLRALAQGAADDSTERGVVAHTGAGAYLVLVTDLVGQDQATLVAERLMAVIAEPIVIESQSLVLTASVGIAFFPNDGDSFARLAHCAERALHAAKKAGPAQRRFFDEHMNARAAQRLRLEADLRRAIDRNELRLHFQAKVDAGSARIVGVEALVRWQHPERGMVAPSDFIPVAEETGLILPLTDWMLESACGCVRNWADAGLPGIPLSVNLAAPSLTDPHFIGNLDALTQRFGIESRCLMLEITESMLIGDIDASLSLLHKLRERGYGLSLDDFGTGYSSLSYLKRMPLDELKIDRAFVIDAVRGERDSALAGAIVALGRELGLKVVAEGVETRAQSAFFLRRGCSVQQGYLFSRPVPADEFARLLRAGRIEIAGSEREAAGLDTSGGGA